MKRITLTLLLIGGPIECQDIPEPHSDFSVTNYVPKVDLPGSHDGPCHNEKCHLAHGSPHLLHGDRGHRSDTRTFAIIAALTTTLGAIITFLMYLDRDSSDSDDDE